MVEEKHKRNDNPALARLEAKSQQSIQNVVTGILERPEIQQIINRNLVKQSFIMGLPMAFLIIGLMMLVSVAKTVIGFDWMGDLAISLALISMGAIFVLRKMS